MLSRTWNDLEVINMKKNNKIKMIRVGILLMLLSGVSACGQKGDLYLPSEANTFVPDFSNID